MAGWGGAQRLRPLAAPPPTDGSDEALCAMQGTIGWAVVAAVCVYPATVQAQSTTWHDDSFTDSMGRTLLYRLWVRSDWDLSRPRGIALFLHGNNRATAEDLRQVKPSWIEETLDRGLAFVVPASPFSVPEDLTFGERSLVGPSVGNGGTRFWHHSDARLIHELLQSGLDGRLAIDYDKVVFSGGSQGTCFLAEFVEFYGGSYGGGFHAWCGCFWLDFDGDDSHDTYAIPPPFHASPWRPTFQWTPYATGAVSDRFSVFVEATTGDFLHPAAESMSRYYSDWLGLRTATDLDSPGGHCGAGGKPRSEIYDWLLSTAGPERSGSPGDTDGDGTPDPLDLDDDNDGAPDFIDALPLDPQDWRDTDGDGIADARDRDADGDGVRNASDPFPLDPSERLDTDGDGIGNRLDGDDDNDGLPDAHDPQPLVGTDDGRSLAFVRNSAGGRVSDHRGFLVQARAGVHAGRPAAVVYPAPQGDAQHYQFLELGDLDRRFEIMVDRFVRPESCRDVLLPPLCDVGRFSASGYYTTYYQNRFDRIWIDRNRNLDLTDDGPPMLLALTEENWPSDTTAAVLEVPYAAGQVLPYGITFSSNDLSNGLKYGGVSVWRGKVMAPSGEQVPVIVVDGNVDGLFNSDGDFACLDFDRNGWLNECGYSEDSHGNRVRAGALTPPFKWDGGRQWLSVAPSGHSVAWRTADTNRPPVPVVGALPDQALPVLGTLTVEASLAFADPDGDSLSYTVSSSAPDVVTVQASGARMTLTAVSEGTATIRVTATDPGGLSAAQAFAVTVSPLVNRRPEAVGVLAPVTLGVDDAAVTVEVGGAFRDPDGDALTYGATSSAPAVASVAVVGSRVTVTPVSEGTSTVTVAATDAAGSNGTATQAFAVTVSPLVNRRPEAVGVLAPVTLGVDDAAVTVEVGGAFRDPDGDALTYGATSSAIQVVTVQAVGARVTVTAVGAGTATIEVTATDPDGLSATQLFWVRVTAPFTDDPIVPGVTLVKAVHFTELRTRIDVLRSEVGLAPFRWTDSVLRAGVTRVKREHLLELRASLAEAYAAAGRTVPRWTDATLAAESTPIRALHLTELRAAVLALE